MIIEENEENEGNEGLQECVVFLPFIGHEAGYANERTEEKNI